MKKATKLFGQFPFLGRLVVTGTLIFYLYAYVIKKYRINFYYLFVFRKSDFRMLKSFIYLFVYKSSSGEDKDTLSLKNLRMASPEANVIKGLKHLLQGPVNPFTSPQSCMAWVQLAILSSGLLLRPTHCKRASVVKYYSFYRPKLAHQQILPIMFANCDKWYSWGKKKKC